MPYSSELNIPFAREPAFLVKKLTVKGNKGYIQGINTAVNPPNKPSINISQSDFCFSAGADVLCVVALASTFACSFLAAMVSARVGISVKVTSADDIVSAV